MAHEHSYHATRTNNRTENEAVDFLLSRDNRFRRPTSTERKEILRILDLPATFSRAFDLIAFPAPHAGPIDEGSLRDACLVELKTTKKFLPNNPDGFFFGATENEFELARRLGDRFRFCFVSLHEDSKGFALLSLPEVETRIATKRVQYQINLRATST